MFEDVMCEELSWGGGKLKLEVGRLARQATSAVYASLGDTSVLATVVVGGTSPDFGFVPLSVHYQERLYAAGRIPGGFFKREGKPTESEVLVSRLIDRSLRPLLDKGFRREVQIMVNLLSYDVETKPDVLAIVAASAALSLSGVPFSGPVAGVRVARIDGEFTLNPSHAQMPSSELDLVVAGTREGVLMVESEARELPEEVMLSAVMFGHDSFRPVLDLIDQLVLRVGKRQVHAESRPVEGLITREVVEPMVRPGLERAYAESRKVERQAAIEDVRAQAVSELTSSHRQAIENGVVTEPAVSAYALELIKAVERDVVRGQILESGRRIDGRDLKTVRPISACVSVLPRAHGSALFTRGETQALVVTTLGTGDDEQRIDGLEGEYKESFMLHYNFPAFSVGEVGRPGSVGRREIGHGKLAWRAIRPLFPDKEAFPHTVRVVSEILESNGSSSMATVCGASLSLMDACVPLARPVSGIAMGLVKQGEKYAVLSDILGDEDDLGDMDFKVAGTEVGVTALQMDLKVAGVSRDIMGLALEQAREGRLSILEEMGKAISEVRREFKDHMPRVETLTIPKDKIREVIGVGGKVIREITEKTMARIDVADSGLVKIASSSQQAIRDAVDWVKRIAFRAGRGDSSGERPEEGRVYDGRVVKIMRYGAFVSFSGSKDGLVHISEITSYRLENVEDVLHEGDKVKVKVIGFDESGKVRLSMKRVDQRTGEDVDVGSRSSDGSRSPTPSGRSSVSSGYSSGGVQKGRGSRGALGSKGSGDRHSGRGQG